MLITMVRYWSREGFHAKCIEDYAHVYIGEEGRKTALQDYEDVREMIKYRETINSILREVVEVLEPKISPDGKLCYFSEFGKLYKRTETNVK